MEKVYRTSGRTSGADSLREMNDEIAEYGGHVVMISTAPDKDWGPVAYVVVDYPNETPPKKD